MGLSQLEIYNHALLKVGADTVDSLTPPASTEDGTKRSIELCNTFFDQAYDEILRIYPWNSAISRIKITLDTTDGTDLFGYSYYGDKPADMVRLVNCFRFPDQSDDTTYWVLEGDYILANYAELYVKYIKKPAETTDLDPLCTNALICMLAMKLCTALQLDDDWAKRINEELYSLVIPQARSIDTIENKELLLEESSWINSRNFEHPYI